MIWSATASRRASAAGVDLRKHPRLATESISCALGEVVDLSSAGMRLNCKSKPPLQVGQEVQVRLLFPRGSLIVTVQARWLRRCGLRKFEMGLQFRNLSPAATQALDSLAHFGFIATPGLKSEPSSSSSSSARKPVKVAVDLPDYYEALGLQPGASIDEIKHAYRVLARTYHPDTTTDPEGPQKFMRIREAYQVLVDAEQRATYDLRFAG